MSLLLYKTLAGLLILLTSLVAVIYPVKILAKPGHNRFLELGDAFASGVFLGAALFHMLPDAIQEFQKSLKNIEYPLAELLCAAGFLILLFFEYLGEHKSQKSHKTTIPLILTIILIIHSLIEGAVLGINTTFATTSLIFLAIIAHKSSESFALAVTLNRGSFKLTTLAIIIGLFSLMTPLGIALGASVTHLLSGRTGSLYSAGFSAFAAGTFLYMSTLHHINHHHRATDSESLLEYLFLIIGLGLMAILVLWS